MNTKRIFGLCVFASLVAWLLTGSMTTSSGYPCPSEDQEAEVDNDEDQSPSDPPEHKCSCTSRYEDLKRYEQNLKETLITGKLTGEVWAWKRERIFYPWGGIIGHDSRVYDVSVPPDELTCPMCGAPLALHDNNRPQETPEYFFDFQCRSRNAAGGKLPACYEVAGSASFDIKGRLNRLPALPYIEHTPYPYELGGATMSLSLGRGEGEEPGARDIPKTDVAGMLCLSSFEPGSHMSQPEGLSLWIFNSGVEEVREASRTNAIRQVMTPDCLVDITVTNDHCYEIAFHYSDEVEEELDENGLYVPTGDWFVRYTVSDPDEGENGYCRLTIEEERGYSVIEHVFEWSEESGGWEYAMGGVQYTVPTTITDTGPLYHKSTRDTNDVLVSRIDEQWGLVSSNGTKDVIHWMAVDPDGANLRTYFTYYTNHNDYMRFEKIKERANPDGSVVKFEYDDIGRITEKKETWKDAEDLRVTTYSYAPVDKLDELTLNYMSPRTITETIDGEMVKKTYYAFYGESTDRVMVKEECVSPAASYGSESNLRSVKKTANEGEWTGYVQQQSKPDGTMETYAYTRGDFDLGSSGSPGAFTTNALGSYVRTTTTRGTTASPSGIAYKTLRKVTIEDRGGRMVQTEDHVYTGSGYSLIAWTKNELDSLGNPIAQYASDGSHSESTWGCCGKESETTADGIEYSYTYDDLKRLTQKVKSGVSASGSYPSQADQYTTYTYDAAGRTLTETRSAGGISMTSSNAYDLAGRTTSRTDFDGRTTTYAYALDGRQVTETYADGTTRITLRHKDGKTQSITGTAQIPNYYTYGVNEDGTQWTKVCQTSSDSAVWNKTTTDLLGHTFKSEKPGYSATEVTENFYNDKNQLVKTSVTGKPDTLFEHDELGNVTRQGLDINDNGSLDLASTDRISESDTAYVWLATQSLGDGWYRQTVSKVYATDGSATATTNSASREQLTGLASGTRSAASSVDVHGNTTVATTTVDRDNALVTRTVDSPFSSSNQVAISRNGLRQSQSSQSGHTTTYSYDALGRQTGATDPRIGTRTVVYNSAGQVSSETDPAGNTTSYTYNNMGRRISVTDPLSNTVYASYTDHGRQQKTWGSGTYPVSYEYDSYDRKTKMHTYRGGTGWTGSTWPASPGTADTTEWIFHEASGLLTSKKDAAAKSATYTYNSANLIATRTWSRQDATNAIVTSYSYNDAGDMTGIDYSDSTPDVTFTVDRLGRQKTASSSVSSHTFTYNAQLQLDTETIVSTAGTTNLLTRTFDGLGRSSGFELDSDYEVAYGYDGHGRMNSVSNFMPFMSFMVNYSYLANSDLLQGMTSSVGLVALREYESSRNLLVSIENKFDTNTISKYAYNNDAGGRRVSVVQTGVAFEPVGDMFNLYDYNTRSEVVDAVRYFGSNTNDTGNPVGLQDWSYAYDNIGNRTGTTKANAAADYTANALNQYTERTVPDSSDIIGSAETNVRVTVNGNNADRQAAYWYYRLGVDNLYTAAYPQVVVEAVFDPGTNEPYVVSSETGNVFVAESPETFTYDDDGNTLSDGRFEYTWDAENRLISATTTTNLPADVPIVHVAFDYDYMSRRTAKRVYEWAAGITNWSLTETRQNVYNGWALIREEVSGGAVTTNWYVHGLDLSGTLSGAGGIGGLLSVVQGTNAYFPTFDANGNVSEYVDASGDIAAHYEYSPFGETIVATGELALENKFRFSTKYFDDETGLSYYGYRYFSPSMGRFISEDPLMELGWRSVKNAIEMTSDWNDRIGYYLVIAEISRLIGQLEQRGYVQYANRLRIALMNVQNRLERSSHRDPHAKEMLNLLLFVSNDPVNRMDYLGLDDVEAALQQFVEPPHEVDEYTEPIKEMSVKSINPLTRLGDRLIELIKGIIEELSNNQQKQEGNTRNSCDELPSLDPD